MNKEKTYIQTRPDYALANQLTSLGLSSPYKNMHYS